MFMLLVLVSSLCFSQITLISIGNFNRGRLVIKIKRTSLFPLLFSISSALLCIIFQCLFKTSHKYYRNWLARTVTTKQWTAENRHLNKDHTSHIHMQVCSPTPLKAAHSMKSHGKKNRFILFAVNPSYSPFAGRWWPCSCKWTPWNQRKHYKSSKCIPMRKSTCSQTPITWQTRARSLHTDSLMQFSHHCEWQDYLHFTGTRTETLSHFPKVT